MASVSDPASLIAVARLTVKEIVPAIEDAQLRRAVSTAYYALFHKIVQSAAARFMGPGHVNTAGYNLIYRGFEHGRMRDVCTRLAKGLDKSMKLDLGRTAISRNMRDFAIAFPQLQEKRHAADYDPNIRFLLADVIGLIDFAETAITAFGRTDPSEQADILALMMVRSRR